MMRIQNKQDRSTSWVFELGAEGEMNKYWYNLLFTSVLISHISKKYGGTWAITVLQLSLNKTKAYKIMMGINRVYSLHLLANTTVLCILTGLGFFFLDTQF